ncbi:Pathogenesis-related protein 5 [Talaromyces islandicus]|uniref:Pathogenesis-related protein 5 n=1 Tax=Talaromyces islandicus TaxID=28573 RepID=A0A0U1M302_TALIS|nr:Pathogenesis-related protein 5 [Talaromyces islandicus]
MVHSLSLTIFTIIGVVVQWLVKYLASKDTDEQDVTLTAPYPCNAIKGSRKFRITMGLRKLDTRNWLTVDKNYMKEHEIRNSLLKNERKNVFECLPESREACAEILEIVSDFLCKRYPSMFQMKKDGAKTEIHNIKTGEIFVSGGSGSTMEPLEIAVRLAMEDLTVLMRNSEGEYYLAASATLFPVGWAVQQRIGWTISQMHGPVPQWKEKIGHSVNKLTPESPMERSSYFMETKESNEGLGNTLFRPDGLTDQEPGPFLDNILLRRERQTFRRLPRTGALVFSVKTTLNTLDELPPDQLRALATEIESWPEDMAKYKGRDVWGQAVLGYSAIHHMKLKPMMLATADASNRPMRITNLCPSDIYPAIQTQAGTGPPSGGYYARPGNTTTFDVSADWQGRIWGRTNCSFNANGLSLNASGPACLTGDCGGLLDCKGTGQPASLAEFTLSTNMGLSFYDISLVDGYNLPIGIISLHSESTNADLKSIPSNTTNPVCIGSPDFLTSVSHMNDNTVPVNTTVGSITYVTPLEEALGANSVSRWCPWPLQIQKPWKPGHGVFPYPDDGIKRPTFDPCLSMCSKYGRASDCCSGSHSTPETCSPNVYSKAAKKVCPDAYSYAYDDTTSTFTIKQGAGFEVIFCPSGRSTDIKKNTGNSTSNS